MKTGEKVFINDPKANYHGETGVIIATDPNGPFPYQVHMADGDFWFTAEEVSATEPSERSPHDFDRGFGIGGLGRHVEETPVPTIEAMKRLKRAEAHARYCRRCGCSDVFDGAMFTTDSSSGLCDDCYG